MRAAASLALSASGESLASRQPNFTCSSSCMIMFDLAQPVRRQIGFRPLRALAHIIKDARLAELDLLEPECRAGIGIDLRLRRLSGKRRKANRGKSAMMRRRNGIIRPS